MFLSQNISRAEDGLDLAHDLPLGPRVRLAFHGPRPSRVQHVPRRALLLVATTPRVVVAEPVNDLVPDRREHFD